MTTPSNQHAALAEPQVKLMTETLTRVRNRLIVFTFQWVNAVTVKSTDLDAITQCCIPAKALSRVTLYGLDGNTARIRVDFAIDYNNDTSRLRISAGHCDANGVLRDEGEAGVASFSEASDDSERLCPVWRQAIDWSTALCEQHGLRLGWTVTFARDRRAWCEKFGLVAARHVDCTRNGDEQAIPNSQLSELTMLVGFDPDLFPEAEGDSET